MNRLQTPLFKYLALGSLCLTSLTAISGSLLDDQGILDEAGRQTVKEIVALPISELSAISTDSGSVYFMSENGRYIISGVMLDTWSRKELTSIGDIKQSIQNANVQSFRLAESDRSNIIFGEGDKTAYLFVDPYCESCHELVKEAQNINGYKFVVVVVPALGPNSDKASREIYCEKDHAKKLAGYLDGNARGSDTSCDFQGYEKTLISAHMLNLKGVPYVVGMDGQLLPGKPANLLKYLQEHES
tara:strand:+ start:2477 stop:3208 length:732 start_codon:yes stop_codon:yes gene_type:complete